MKAMRITVAAKVAFDALAFRWKGVEARPYKPSTDPAPGMAWSGISRFTISRAQETGAAFETRYFEIAPGGYSSLEKHTHAHQILVLRGFGRALVGREVLDLHPLDIVSVGAGVPHRWVNSGEEPFGFLCTVDAERDRPQPVSEEEWAALKVDPRTAPFVF
jgi:quercetin dioxygenase-like cupin family protein